mmetsp:Transcript_30072/g.67309  ORF Transcript_30072/g.67309 Transcript_30072/m.67309 type:complete len:239 (-) Transcript_30072:502-1218(-)
MSGEWKAYSTSSLQIMADSPSTSSVRCTPSILPESTTLLALFTAATAASSVAFAATIAPSTCALVARRATITPSAKSAFLTHSARAQTSFRQLSIDITPATTAAAYSPRLWPSTREGQWPRDIHSCARQYSSATSAGCAKHVSSSSSTACLSTSARGYRMDEIGMPRRGSAAASQRSIALRNATLQKYRLRPTFMASVPCPENCHTVGFENSAGRMGASTLLECAGGSSISACAMVPL